MGTAKGQIFSVMTSASSDAFGSKG